MLKGNVFNIQRYTIHDGPGIRTEIFFKGCPLRCKWCSNPEGFWIYSQPGIYPSKCIGLKQCGFCKTACIDDDMIQFKDNRISNVERTRCTGCMKCCDACPSDAIKAWGREETVAGLMDIILKDKDFFIPSGGGVTLSGGEPLMQSDFVKELLMECKRHRIHTCVETTLFADWDIIEKVAQYTDLFISDLKHMQTDIHKKYTGVSNRKILRNMIKLVCSGKPLILRIPVIPSVNDTKEVMEAAADFIITQLNGKILRLQLLEYMHLGLEKYQSLDMDYSMDYLDYDKDIFTEKVKEFAAYFNSRGICCMYGTGTESKLQMVTDKKEE